MHLLQLNEEKWKEETKKRNKREGTKKGFLPDPFSLHDSSLYDSVVITSTTAAFSECILSKGFLYCYQ